MKLKKLEINGFKSFFEKAAITFPAGISAVVGPNGCGKSNIIDAIRWVMGEQSLKQLRGKSREDVIFAGTSGKSPLNLAEVSLTLSNDNGDAPEELKDFTEINLTRRLYRSGESAYFLNKQPCRLKDIHNVFLGSGMGTKSYATIQQGNIGAITDAGPEERRHFIEEAAGVTRYKTRKIEALGKINATNQNLLRLKDIIAEVKRQMTGLKRQATLAEKYQRIQKRIRKLDILLNLHHHDQYSHEIQETETLLGGLRDTNIAHTSQLKKIDAAVEEIKLKRWQKSQEISEQKARKFETQRQIDRIENDLDHLRNEINRLEGESRELTTAKHELEGKNKQITSEMALVEDQNKHLVQKIEGIKTAHDNERTASQTLRETSAALNSRLETQKAKLMDLVAQEARTNNIYQNATSNKESLERRLKRADEEAAVAQKNVEQIAAGEADAKESLNFFTQEKESLDRRAKNLQEKLNDRAKSLGNQVKQVQTLDLQRKELKSRYSALKKMEESFEWYRDGVKAIMKKEGPSEDGTDGFPGKESVIGLMADILDPEPSFETAVEAVLGESLQYILVKDQSAGMAAIDYLQSRDRGRGGFIPVSAVKPMKNEQQNGPDLNKRLLNHVTVKSGFENIAHALLGHTVVADTLQEATALFNRNGVCQTIVTKDGQVLSHQGIMIGGSKDKLSGILVKKQELKVLEQQMDQLDRQLDSDRQTLKELEAEVRQLESDLQKLLEEKSRAVQKEMEAEKALYKVSEELKHARRHLDVARLDQERLMDEANDIDQEMAKFNRVLDEISREVKAAQEQVSETTIQSGKLSSEMEAYEQRIVDLKLQLTSLNAQLENSDNTFRRLKEFREDGEKRHEQLARDIALKDEKAVASRAKTAEHQEKTESMYVTLKQLEETLASNEADYQATDAELKDKDGMISDIQSKQQETLEKIRLLEIEQSQRQIKQENISNRLLERYHRSPSQLKTDLPDIFSPDSVPTEVDPKELEEKLERFRKRIAHIGDVNLGAIKEYEQLQDRYVFLNEQHDDLIKAIDDLHKVIKKINIITQKKFIETFDLINEKLTEVFPRLFNGGKAILVQTDPDNPLETGVEFMIHPPGKKLTRLSLLSGGEKALAAIAFIFSIFLIKPASFCLLDEIDAPLDDANVSRFNNLLKIIGEKSQIVMITHNKRSMEFADTLFGITMEQKGVSKVVSVNLTRDEAPVEAEPAMV